MLINPSSGYHNLKIDKRPSYLTMVSDRYRDIRLPFRMIPAVDIFQKKTYDLLNGNPNISSISGDIFMAGSTE